MDTIESLRANLAQSESIANFRLIEMSRLMGQRDELLAALERMTGEFLMHIQFSVEGGNADTFHACLSQARAAIAKAKGE